MIKNRCLPICLLCLLMPAYADHQITANALFDGKALLMVDNVPIAFSVGQRKEGIKLISADDNQAVIIVHGRRKVLQLDKSIAKEYATPDELDKHESSKTHILSVRLIHQTPNLATFEVDYFYNERLAEHVALSAKTLFKERVTEYWQHTYTRLNPGRHTTTITVSMNNNAPINYTSDAIRFDLNWSRKEKSGVADSKIIEFIKQWHQ